MTDIRSLEQTLLDNLLQNKARIKFVARFLLALVSLRQNGVGTGFVMADAILPKGHERVLHWPADPVLLYATSAAEQASQSTDCRQLSRYVQTPTAICQRPEW